MDRIANKIQCQITGYTEQKGGKLRGGMKPIEIPKYSNKTFLGNVFSVFSRVNHTLAEMRQLAFIPFNEFGERVHIPITR